MRQHFNMHALLWYHHALIDIIYHTLYLNTTSQLLKDSRSMSKGTPIAHLAEHWHRMTMQMP